MMLDLKSRFHIRRGAVSAHRHFSKGCGRPESKSNPNSNHVSDVDLESKGKEVKVESGLKNNNESENMDENVEEMTFASEKNTDENVEESIDSMEIAGENVGAMFDSEKIPDEDVDESFDTKEVNEGNVKESFDSTKKKDENAEEKFNSVKCIGENAVEIFYSEKFPDGNVEKPLELVNGDVKKGLSNMIRTHFVKRKGQLSVGRHFPVGCGRNVPVENKVSRHFPVGCGRNVTVENKVLSLVVEQIETSECKALEDESEGGAIVKHVCEDVNNIVESCKDNNEHDEINHEYEKGKSLIGEKKRLMEVEAPAPKKPKKEDKDNGTNGDVTVDLLNKKKKKVSKVVARKSASNEATNIKRKSTDEELDDSLEDCTDKLFVQALKSSDDSSWRNDKKPSGIISNSATPKYKKKKSSYS